MSQLGLWDTSTVEPATPTRPTEAPVQQPKTVLPLPQLYQDIVRQTSDIFECMAIAEKCIEKAMKRHPEKRDLLYGAFMTLCPVFTMSLKTYEAHCKELLARIAKGSGNLNDATDGEVLAALQRTAWIIPLHNEPSALFSKLFQELFPEMVFDGLDMLSERYPGETDALRDEMRRLLSKNIRRKPPVERTPYKVLLQIEKEKGKPEGWADEENMAQLKRAREIHEAYERGKGQ